ncbi:MAG: hypothetical protein IPQ09_19060 [Myxococcales bacterium]|nr:hypothetical protein [Myxococcales bacterium]
MSAGRAASAFAFRAALVCLLAALSPVACSPSSGPSGGSSLVVGVTGEDLRTLLESVKVTAKVNGEVAKEATVVRDGDGVLRFPAEVTLEGAPGAPVEVTLVGYGAPPVATRGPSDPPAASVALLNRLVTTTMPKEKSLVRVQLDSRCLPIGTDPIQCPGGTTCQGGRCVDAAVSASSLEPYAPDWPTNAPDPCRPANAGPPEIAIGKGQTDYSSLAPNETLKMELGPQGGHHIWIAVRLRNLKQAGSRTALSAVQPTTGLKATPTAFVFTLDTDEGGYCKLYGLRFQLDAGGDLGTAYKAFLGKPLDVTVEVTDVAGRTATATQRVNIADKLLCPDGTEKCNTP